MCLLTSKGSYIRANEDITCYKVVYLTENGKWKSAFGHCDKEFEFDTVLVETKGRPKPRRDINRNNEVLLTKGYYHSCMFKETCKYVNKISYKLRSEFRLPCDPNNFVVCKCTIPKGTVYYIGKYEALYASRKIIVHKPKKL